MCCPASMSGPLRILWLSNGTLSPSGVTWLLPSGTKRPVLPARTRAHAGVPSTWSLNTCSTVPTTLPSAPVTRAPRRSSACVVIVTSPPESLSPDSDGIGPQLPNPITQCKLPTTGCFSTAHPGMANRTSRALQPLRRRAAAQDQSTVSRSVAWVASMSGYGGIVQPDHSDLVCGLPRGRAGLLRCPRVPGHLRGPRIPVFPRPRSRQDRVRHRVAARLLASHAGPGADLAIRRERSRAGKEAASRHRRPFSRGTDGAQPGLAVPRRACPDTQRLPPLAGRGQRLAVQR